MFSTAQQLGGACWGVAIIGAVFFSQRQGHSFTRAFEHAPVVAELFAAAAAPALVLPRTAVREEAVAEL